MTTLASTYKWKWRPRVRQRLYQVQVNLFKGLAALLPGMSRVALRSAIDTRGKMDYLKDDIFLNVGSWIEYDKRLKSCAKEPETVAWIEEFIRGGDVVYDIGANVGAYSLLIAKHLSGRGKVYAFEPSFSTFAQLCGNVALNQCSETVSPMYVALAEHTGMAYFNYTSMDAGTALHALGDAAGLAKVVHRQPILSFALDELIDHFSLERPNHIKLDVDGIEFDILRGARQALSDPALRTIIVETEETREGADRIREVLGDAGFTLHSEHIHNQNPFHPGPYVRNCIFVK